MRTITYAGHVLSLTAWSRFLGIPRSTLAARYSRYPYLSHAAILGAMETHGHWRGHPIVTFAHEAWSCMRFVPDLAPCPAFGHPAGKERPCAACSLQAPPWLPTGDMPPDPCLGMLPGVRFACCGHGRMDETCRPYVILDDGTRLDDAMALAYFAQHGKGPQNTPMRKDMV